MKPQSCLYIRESSSKQSTCIFTRLIQRWRLCEVYHKNQKHFPTDLFFFLFWSDLEHPLPLFNLWLARRNPGSEKWVRLVWKPWIEDRATGPPNNTKEAPQLFGGNTSLHEVSVFCTELPGCRSCWLSERSCDVNTATQSSHFLWGCKIVVTYYGLATANCKDDLNIYLPLNWYFYDAIATKQIETKIQALQKQNRSQLRTESHKEGNKKSPLQKVGPFEEPTVKCVTSLRELAVKCS